MHLIVLGNEAVRTDVEAATVEGNGSGKATDAIQAFEQRDRSAVTNCFMRRSKTRRSSSDDY